VFFFCLGGVKKKKIKRGGGGGGGGEVRNSLYTYLLFPEHRCTSLQYTYSFGSDGYQTSPGITCCIFQGYFWPSKGRHPVNERRTGRYRALSGTQREITWPVCIQPGSHANHQRGTWIWVTSGNAFVYRLRIGLCPLCGLVLQWEYKVLTFGPEVCYCA